jgi:CO/xanthine dehydrogenase FAD-binding subunit
MLYKNFQTATSLNEAVSLLDHHNGGNVRLVAGGTDLILQLHERILSVDTLIDISRVPELRGIRAEAGSIIIGASTTYSEIASSPLILRNAYLLVEASKQIGAAQIQNMATIGGNIGNASPAADAIPCLYALDAVVLVKSVHGERRIPIREFHQGYRKVDLRPGELIVEISFPIPANGSSSAFYKYALRKSQAISVVNASTLLQVKEGRIERAAVALGAVAPTIIRSPEAEAALLGQEPTMEVFKQAGEAARQDASPISDIRGSAAFRHYLVGVSVTRALEDAWQRTEINQEDGR